MSDSAALGGAALSLRPLFVREPARTIEDVVDRLNDTVEQSRMKSSPLGYWAVLYLAVSEQLGRAVRSSTYFRHPRRIEAVAVRFAQIYFDALDEHLAGLPVRGLWALHFELAQLERSVLQHLLASVCVHVVHDLPLVLSQLFNRTELVEIAEDFNRMTRLFHSVYTQITRGIAEILPGGTALPPLIIRQLELIEQALFEGLRLLGFREAGRIAAAQTYSAAERARTEVKLRTKRVGDWISHPPEPAARMFEALARVEHGTVRQRIDALNRRPPGSANPLTGRGGSGLQALLRQARRRVTQRLIPTAACETMW